MSRLLATTLLVAGLLAAATAAGAQTESLEIKTIDAADYPTVTLTVTVPPSAADFPLPPDAFAITEDGEPRGRPSLGQGQGPTAEEPTAPRTVLAIDTSGSMNGAPIESARAAATEFIDGLRPGSEVAIVTFGDRTNVVSDFTSDVGALRSAIGSITVDPAAETALFDGVRRADRLLARVSPDVPRSIVLLADGENSAGRSTLDDAVADLERSGVTLWAVGLETPQGNLDALDALVTVEDGVLSAGNAAELRDIYSGLALDVSRQYVLRYESAASGETIIAVDLDAGSVSASTKVRTSIEGRPAGPGQGPTPERTAVTAPYTVTVPLLGTTAAYRAGLASLVLAGALVVWMLTSGPGRATRQQLLPTPRSERREGLTAVAEWVTSQADQRLRGRQLGGRIDRALEDAGLDVRTGEFVVGVLSMMVVAYALGLAVASPLIGVVLTLVPLIAARLVLSILRDRRRAAFAEQFIDVLQLLAGSLRAGYGMLQGIDVIARDAQEPAASEFRRILLEHRLGRDLTEAMDNCADRMGNDDFRWVVQAISIHREVGGDLARVLDNVVGTVRERAAVARQVRAMSAEGRLSARVLTALPFVVLLVISIIDPTYFNELTSRTIGWVLLGIAGTMLLIGTFVVHRMVKVQY